MGNLLFLASIRVGILGGGPRMEDLPGSNWFLEIFLQLQLYSWILDNPKALFSDWGLRIYTGSLISSFNPLRKQLSLCADERPLILFDKTLNWAIYTATEEACLNLVSVSIGPSYAVVPNLTCKAWIKESQTWNTPVSSPSWNQIRASPSMWNEANINFYLMGVL